MYELSAKNDRLSKVRCNTVPWAVTCPSIFVCHKKWLFTCILKFLEHINEFIPCFWNLNSMFFEFVNVINDTGSVCCIRNAIYLLFFVLVYIIYHLKVGFLNVGNVIFAA